MKFLKDQYKKSSFGATTIPGPPLLDIEDIDQSMVDLYDKRLNFHLDSIRQRNQEGVSNQKVPIVFTGAELFWLDSKNMDYIRDEEGAIITPVITITRRNISKNDYTGIKINKYQRRIVHRRQTPTGPRKLKTPNQKGVIIGKNSNKVKHPPVEFISAPRPEYYGITYDVIYWCSYQEHMNELIQRTQDGLDAEKMFYLQLDNGWKLEAFFEGEFSYGGNIDNYFSDERIIKYQLSIKINAPINNESGVNHAVYLSKSPRSLTFKINDDGNNFIERIDEERAMDYLKFRNIHGSGADIVDEAVLSPENLNPYSRPRRRIYSNFNTPLFSTARLRELLLYQPTVATRKEYSISESIKSQRKAGKKEKQLRPESQEVLDLIFNPKIIIQS